MRATRFALLALIACAVALAGCDKARSAKGGAAVATDCTGCHGGRDNTTGAPPNDTRGNTTHTVPTVGAHTKHIDAGFDCDACHRKPTRLRDPGHISGTAEIVFGDLAKLPDGSAAPQYVRPNCTNVYCHGAKLDPTHRGLAVNPDWTSSPLPGAAQCASCHGQANNAGAPPAPHLTGLVKTDCTTCHPGTVDANGDLIPTAQGGLHLNGRPDIAALACTSCHGDRTASRPADAGSPASFAPPQDTSGATTGAKVGAHLRHVSSVVGLASRYSQPFPCTECHTMPQASGPHGPPSVVQFGTAAAPAKNVATTGGLTPVYTAAGGTCASTYCHGGSLNAGGSNHVPAWNTSSVDGCGTCHFQGSTVSTAPNHPQVDAVVGGQPITANTQCYKCHSTMDSSGQFVGLGSHVNGTVEFSNPHAGTAGWLSATGGIHGGYAKLDLGLCQKCHGATFATVVTTVNGNGKSCNACHANPSLFVAGYTGASHPAWQTECTFCHGNASRADVTAQDAAGTPAINAGKIVPPRATQSAGAIPGEPDAVGAHMRHTSDLAGSGNRFTSPIKCQQCHGATALTDAAHQGVGHADAQVNIGWQLAAIGTVPVITPPLTLPASTIPAARTKAGLSRGSEVTCANYCHGATLSGGTLKVVTWSATGSVTGCDACHGFPPPYTAPTWHTASANKGTCSSCHYPGLPDASVNMALHVNGVPNVIAGLACNACHGSAANAAPPGAASASVPDTDPRVGAHQAHVVGSALRATSIACTECHGTLPTAPGHADGKVALLWGALASANGATLFPVAGPKDPGLTASCTNYCHGGAWAAATPVTNADYRGTNTSPVWAPVGSGQAACGTCHKIAPTNSTHTGANAAVGPVNCQTCHPGYNCTSDLPGACQVNKLTHINGQLDANLTCTSCHGTAGRAMAAGTLGPSQASANLIVAMPPLDTASGSSGLRVGAHAAHAVPTVPGQVFRPVLCAECHGAAVNGYTTSHKNGITELTFASSASANLGNVAASITPGTGTTPDSCTTYCHGASLTPAQRGSVSVWSWSSAAPQATCGSCHGTAPGDPVHTSVGTSAPVTACNPCHSTVVNTSGGIVFNGTGSSATTLHMNGSRQNTATCFSCHGSSAAGSIAPPAATSGSSAVTNPKVGAHQKHLTGTTLRTAAIACYACHPVVSSVTHASGTVDLSWSTLATAVGGFTLYPAAGGLPAGWEAAPTCTNYCHGGKWAAIPTTRGNQYQPSWTLGTSQAACSSCHLAPPGTGDHASVTSSTNCGDCHDGYNCFGNSLATCAVNKTIHLNGSVEATGGTCVGCHAKAITTGSVPRRAIVPEFGYAWSHKRSASPAGTVTANDCAVCHMEGVAATGAIDTTYHRNGLVNLRDPDLGTQIKQVTWGGANAGGYTSTAVDATFATFGRNLSSNVLEPTVQAIMINQCLKCHDADGAASALARVPAGSAAKPFGTTITGAEYTGAGITAGGTAGGVVDVNASFATSNASYHPIRGKQNNSYVTATRMNAPWNGITKTSGNTTSWGYLISCWDCHAPTGATGLQTLTVTAHGGTTTLRRNVYLNSASDNLCRVCHIARIGNGDNHGTGSAFSTGGGGGMGSSRIDVTCYNCHGSKNGTATTGTANRPPRPYVAQDAHGFDGFSPAMGADTMWPTGSASNTYKPYAFMRNVGPTGSWNNTLNWRPGSAPGITTGSGSCGGQLTSSACNENMQSYTPGGNY